MVQYSKIKYMPLMVFQLILLALYWMFVRYGFEKAKPTKGFEDTHVMIFIGFGYLMTFLKKYCYSALGFNWFLAALSIQWALLCQNFYKMRDHTIVVTKLVLLQADIMSATVLITFGALLGIASGVQMLYISIIEIFVASFNFWLCEHNLYISDVGGSMLIHTFGAYFGLGTSLGFKIGSRIRKRGGGEGGGVQSDLIGPSYVSDTTAMIGSIFLWIYWPSFNAALTFTDPEYQRAVANTYLSLASATVTTFIISSIVNHEKGKFDMVHVQNSTLAGGVAVGAVCNMYMGAGAAIAAGIGAGVISVLGYKYLTPKLARCGVLDTCGVNNLHGMPGVYSGLLSVLYAALATKDEYGDEMELIFIGRSFFNRSAGMQALYQFFGLLASIFISFGSGILTGVLMQFPCFDPLEDSQRYDDVANWVLPK